MIFHFFQIYNIKLEISAITVQIKFLELEHVSLNLKEDKASYLNNMILMKLYNYPI